MPIRRAHMATFPAREKTLAAVLRTLCPQVDALFLQLNGYTEIPAFLAGFANVRPALAAEDFRDVGKFVPAPDPQDRVFLVDDDLLYPRDYCDRTEAEASAFDLARTVVGFHARTLGPRGHRFHFRRGLRRSLHADQLGTGTVFALGRNVAPLAFMRGAEGFVDVRYARWCVEHDLARVCLRRPWNWIRPVHAEGPTLYDTVTRAAPPHVTAESRALEGRTPDAGTPAGPPLTVGDWLFGGWR